MEDGSKKAISLRNGQKSTRYSDRGTVTDSAGQAIRLIDLYNVSVLPRCFLIDENHKIILKTENDLELEQALENIFEEE